MQKKCLIIILAILTIVGAQCLAKDPVQTSPLFTYVNQPDSSYAWTKATETKLEGGATWVKVGLTSQTWQKIVWKHDLSIILPKTIRDGSTVLLLIRQDATDQNYAQRVAAGADVIGMPIAILGDIPNQPLWDKYEDDLIAHTLVKAIETGDLTWPLLFPMTKSVVRAMDAIQSLAKKEWRAPVKGFVVSGASKRGWTTYMTGAVDKRVVGIGPGVYDCLNMSKQMAHQIKTYGSASAMVSEYDQQGLVQFAMSPEGREFAAMVDPYTFRKQLTMPKMILLGSNDPYWTLESPSLYFRDLPGDNHIHYSPNQGHVSPDELDAAYALAALAVACGKGEHLQKLTWSYAPKPDGLQLTIRPGKQAQAVRVWTANSDTKDFRQARWTAHTVEGKSGVYVFTLPRPEKGFSALFGEAEYTENGLGYTQNTTPRIWPAK